MEPSTQAALVAGLVALLLLLLVVRSVSRRRARRAGDDAQAEPQVQVVDLEHEEHDEHEEAEEPVLEQLLQPEPAVEPEPELEPEVEADADADADAQPEAEQPRRRRGLFRRRAAVPAAAVELVEPVDADAEPTVAVDAAAVADALAEVDAAVAETPEQAELRALREQLRALEEIVQQRTSEPPTATLTTMEEAVAEQSATYLRQVALVVRGLAAHTSEEENPRRTLARVAAAVERLGVPNTIERPILPVTKELSSSTRQGLPDPSHLRPAEVPAEPAHQPVDVFAGLDLASAPAPAHPAEAAAYPTQAPAYPAEAAAASPAPPTTTLHDLAALDAYDQGPLGGPEPLGGPDALGGLDAVGGLGAYGDGDALGGIPAFDEPEVVLPVPPPAAPEPPRKRFGRKSR